MDAHAKVAQKFGQINPTDKEGVAAFYKDVVPSMNPEQQQDVFEALIHSSATSVHAKSLESLEVAEAASPVFSFDDPSEEAPLLESGERGSLEKIDRIIGIFEWAVKFSESEDVREKALSELGSLGRALLLQGQSKVSEPLSNNPASGTDGEGGRESAASASQALRRVLDTAEQEQQELPSSIEEYDDHRDEKEQTS